MRGLTDKVAIVTGATKTMGADIAARLAAEGCAIAAIGRSADDGVAVASGIEERGGRATFFRCDVGIEEEVAATVQAVIDQFGRIDFVVNNAFAVEIMRAGQSRPAVDEDTANFDTYMKVGVYGPFWLAKHAIPSMRSVGGGAFVSISSQVTNLACAGMTGYGVAKSGLECLMRQLAADYGPVNIRANTVRLGAIRVDTSAAFFDHPRMGPMLRSTQSLDRTGMTDDVASAVAFLLSDEAAFITGTVLAVDGGSTAKLFVPDATEILAELGGPAG